jgi:hypothetical protein
MTLNRLYVSKVEACSEFMPHTCITYLPSLSFSFNLSSSWIGFLLRIVIVIPLAKKFRNFKGGKFTVVFTRDRHLTLS